MKKLVLNEIMENVGVMLAYFDADFNFLVVNSAYAQGSGYKPEELIGKNHFELFPNEENKKIFENVKKSGKRVKFFDKPFEYVNQPERGTTYWDWTLSPVKTEKGHVNGFILSLSETTQRKKMEQKLEESKSNLRRMFEQAPDGVLFFDLNGMVTDCNSFCLSFGDFSREDFVGKSFSELTELLDGAFDFSNLYSSLLEGKSIEPFEITFRDNDNKLHIGEIHTSLIRNDNELSGFQAIFRDITTRKNVEHALRDSEKRFRELSELLPEVIFETDSMGTLTFVNQSSYERFGYSIEEFKGGLHALQMISPKDRNLAKANLKKLLLGEDVGPNQYIAIRKNGTEFPIIVNSCPVILDGKVVGIRGIMVDITEYMKTENALKETLDDLESLNEKLHVIGKSTRHDVRNKLSVIVNNLFLAKQNLTNNKPVLKYLDQIELVIDQITNIFDFSRTYEKLGTEKLTDVNVGKMLHEAFQLVSGSDNVKLVNQCNDLTVKADSLLRQSFYNLIDDSLKHGEKVSTIKVYHYDQGDCIKIVYEDDGVGIPTTEKQKIFEEGYGKGTGYGLYLVEKTCEVYGWSIKETGTYGEKAQFTISIPNRFNI